MRKNVSVTVLNSDERSERFFFKETNKQKKKEKKCSLYFAATISFGFIIKRCDKM